MFSNFKFVQVYLNRRHWTYLCCITVMGQELHWPEKEKSALPRRYRHCRDGGTSERFSGHRQVWCTCYCPKAPAIRMLLPKTGTRTPVGSYSQIICIHSGSCTQYTKTLMGNKKSRSIWPRPPSCQEWQVWLSAPSLALSSPVQWQLCVSQLSSSVTALSVSLSSKPCSQLPAPHCAIGSAVTEVSCVGSHQPVSL